MIVLVCGFLSFHDYVVYSNEQNPVSNENLSSSIEVENIFK